MGSATSPRTAEQILRKLVMAWDADESDEHEELLDEARALLGLTLICRRDPERCQMPGCPSRPDCEWAGKGPDR